MKEPRPKAAVGSDSEAEALKKVDEAVRRTASRFQDYEPDLVVLGPGGEKIPVAELKFRVTNSKALSSVLNQAQTYVPELGFNNFVMIVSDISSAKSLQELNQKKHLLVGKGSIFQQMGPRLRELPIEARRIVANTTNSASELSTAIFELRQVELKSVELEQELAAGRVDLSLPAPPRRHGAVHPILQVMDEMIAVFAEMGFGVAEGPDIEDDFHNFTALNFPPRHPAREMHDTFFLKPGPDGERKLLRTHTSPIQVRVMRKANIAVGAPQFEVYQAPPIRIVGPGRVYRCDSDATHAPMFHQMEGLVIDRAIHMGHLKWTLDAFVRRFFEAETVVTRFRPHHFPFTEPSAEMDVQCDRSGGQIRIGEGSDWLEILGGGMVHPNILRNCGLDPDEWQGFAFGLGVDRLAALKYGMPDLRDMFTGDVRWLEHYGFSAFADPNPASGLS